MPEIELTGERTARGTWAMFDWRMKRMRLARIRVDAVAGSEGL